MARKKKPLNETEEQALIRRDLETISNFSSRSEKTSWNRKMNNMVKLLALLRPIEEKILDLQSQKEPVFDEIQILRAVMVKECIHPQEYLIHKGDYVECKFCNKRIAIKKNASKKTKS